MNSLKILLVLAIQMAVLITLSLGQAKHSDEANVEEARKLQDIDNYRGSSRFLNSKKYPAYNPSKPWDFFHSKKDQFEPRGYFPRKKHPSYDAFKFWDHSRHKEYPSYGQFGPWGWQPRNQLTCDRFPRMCRAKGSPGPDCCKKRCVNVKTDNFNCGMCGLRCKYPDMCCNGKCVNPLHDRKHCGGCHNKCNRGSFCYYGMCSYA